VTGERREALREAAIEAGEWDPGCIPSYRNGWDDGYRVALADELLAVERDAILATPHEEQDAAEPPALDVERLARIERIVYEHRLCGVPYEGCFAHWPHMQHCRADGIAWPCDTHIVAAEYARLAREARRGA